MSVSRRTFLQSSILGGIAAVILPHSVLAEWPEKAFKAESSADAMNALFGDDSSATESDKIIVSAPDIAENGSVVPVEVDASGLENVKSITIIAEKNPVPLVAQFQLGAEAVPQVSTRIKMASTSDVVAVVDAGGKLYTAKKEVKVTIGGCGG
jgi:sulfur-oxidizing protein SoxY